MATQKLYCKFHGFTILPKGNPIEAPHALQDKNNRIAEKGMGIPDTFTHARFVCALPDEYGHIKATLQAMKNRDRAEIIRMVRTRYSTLPPETRVAAIVPAARSSIFFERKRRLERCITRSWPRSQGHPGPWPRREQQYGWR